MTAASGVLSGVLVAVVQSWNERRERLRDLRIDAAHKFVSAVIEGLTPIAAILRADPVDWKALRPTYDQITAAYDASITTTARVDLLFGVKSPTGQASGNLTEAFAAVKKEIESQPDDLTQVRELRDAAADRLDDFTNAAHSVVVASWWRRPAKPSQPESQG